LDSVRDANVDNENMILRLVDDLVKSRDHLRMPTPIESALKNRQLQPLAIRVHRAKHCTPPLLVSDIVCDDVQVLFHRSSLLPGREPWKVVYVTQEISSE
jgi:hypothetical protein